VRQAVSGALLHGVLRYWELKLLSLVIAFALWLFVVGGEKGEIVLSARVEYLNVPSGLMLAGSAPDTVDVQVQGSRSALRRLTSDDFRAQVDAARVGADALVELHPDQVLAPRDVTVLRVSPARLRLTLEPVATAEVRVVPQLTGSPEPGYGVARVSVAPPTVEVRGPRSEVANRPNVQTSPIDISGVRGPITRRAELVPAPGAVRLTKRRSVDVTVEVREERDTHAGGGPR
jgi:YbbR domain-containing protein